MGRLKDVVKANWMNVLAILLVGFAAYEQGYNKGDSNAYQQSQITYGDWSRVQIENNVTWYYAGYRCDATNSHCQYTIAQPLREGEFIEGYNNFYLTPQHY